MGEAQGLQLHIMVQGTKEGNSPEPSVSATNQPTAHRPRNFRWIRIALYTFFVLSGQAVATMLGRQYYDKGGNSKWMATLVQLVGFPIFLPYYFFPPQKGSSTRSIQTSPPSLFVLASVYASIGLIVAADCFLYSIGLLYLPVSTYSLICASQLAFNSLFSFFLNSQKFTPAIINSLVILTTSSTVLVFQNDSEDSAEVSKAKYAIGFICTVGASAGYGLVLSLTQLAFTKVLKKQTFRVILDLIVYPNMVACCAIVVGLFASREWKTIKGEMEEYEMGKVSYVMNLIWTAISWQVFAIGAVGLILESSSLFSNAISVLGLPIVPILAVVFFHDKMGGIKVIAMVLALWGFISYVYQLYLDDLESKNENKKTEELPQPHTGTQ